MGIMEAITRIAGEVMLNGILGVFRVFFARRLDKPDHSVGIGSGFSFL